MNLFVSAVFFFSIVLHLYGCFTSFPCHLFSFFLFRAVCCQSQLHLPNSTLCFFRRVNLNSYATHFLSTPTLATLESFIHVKICSPSHLHICGSWAFVITTAGKERNLQDSSLSYCFWKTTLATHWRDFQMKIT